MLFNCALKEQRNPLAPFIGHFERDHLLTFLHVLPRENQRKFHSLSIPLTWCDLRIKSMTMNEKRFVRATRRIRPAFRYEKFSDVGSQFV